MAQEQEDVTGKRRTGNNIGFRVIIIALLLVASAGMALYLRTSPSRIEVPTELQGVLWPAPKSLKEFNLIGHDSRPFTLESLKGQWTMLFFGYTYCPDICPTALAILSAVYQRLDSHEGVIQDTQVVFVSVDPKRDPPERLAEYMAFFDKRFSAATGEVKEIDGLASQVGAGYQIEPGESENYLISHTGSIFLVDPEARLLGAFSFPHNTEVIADQYLGIRALRGH